MRAYFSSDFSIYSMPLNIVMSHPVGIVTVDAEIGEGCQILQNVTIGKVSGKSPVIGSNVFIGAGSIIIGDVKVGDNVVIGAGSVVVKNIPSNCTYINRIEPRILKNGR